MSGQGVYMAQDGLGRVKIGVTRDIGQRLSGLRTGSSTPLDLIRFIEGASPKVERWFHRRFKDLRIRGEWFHFTPEMMDVRPPEEITTIKRMVRRRDIRLTIQERIRQADETADIMGLTARQRLMFLIQQVEGEEAEALCEAIRDFSAAKPGVVA